MEIKELYLKTLFCCMACDGAIVEEELDLVRRVVGGTEFIADLDVESILNRYVAEINEIGSRFLKKYLNELSAGNLTKEEALQVIKLAIDMIDADKNIAYSEVKFFKKIRACLQLSDEQILSQHPDKADFLLPDIMVVEDPIWDDQIMFSNIVLEKL